MSRDKSHDIFTDSWSESEIEIEMALLKYFAPLKKNLPDPWVWLHLPWLSSKIKTCKYNG